MSIFILCAMNRIDSNETEHNCVRNQVKCDSFFFIMAQTNEKFGQSNDSHQKEEQDNRE